MGLSAEQIEEYFERYEWTYNRTSETTWVTGVRTSVASFRIFLRLTEHWVYFVINPYVVTPPKVDNRLRFYYNVLRYNLDLNMAKFGLDSDGDLFLAIELPTESFEYSHFSDALNGLSHHAERLYSEIFNLAHNPALMQARFDEELDGVLYNDAHAEENEESKDSENTKRPLDDLDLPEEEDEDEDDRAIIGGKEVRIVDDGKGFRLEFETAHDLDDDEPTPPANSSPEEDKKDENDTDDDDKQPS